MRVRNVMTKRILAGVAGILFLAFIAWWIYTDHAFRNYPDNSVRRITGVRHFTVLQKTHTDSDWHETIEINPQDADKVLREYPFKPGYANAVVEGRYVPDYLHDCLTCSYYFKKEHGPYEYLLLVLSEDKKDLFVYEEFGD